jgi:hypothetical protein
LATRDKPLQTFSCAVISSCSAGVQLGEKDALPSNREGTAATKLNPRAKDIRRKDIQGHVLYIAYRLINVVVGFEAPTAPCYLLHAGFWPGLFFDLENGGDIFL